MNSLKKTGQSKGKNITVLLVAGHAGLIDGQYGTKGKRSPKWSDGSQLFEGEFNRQIKYRLMELLHANGYKYVDLIEGQSELHNKHLDRVSRVFDATYYYRGNKNCYLLEIHANAGGGTGMEFYIASNASSKSKALAQAFKDNYDFNIPFRGIKVKDFDTIYNYPMPCGLFEAPFMDTESDCKDYLMSPEGRDRIAQYLFKSLVRGLDTISR
jgi:N-acetylmuramoyl-L-alanine amidase